MLKGALPSGPENDVSASPPIAGRATGYRTDIDGLRAVAVIPVVAFHAGVHLVRGGFIGVDIFFVISGFLITQLLMKDIAKSRFSLSAFYERRIRRILPALVVVFFVVYLLGLYYCLPEEFVDLSKSLIAASGSISNFYFWWTSGYFERLASTKPLLHTWSLAVEEQFYLFWPLLLYLGHRLMGDRVRNLVILIAVASLILSIVCVFPYPTATFYLPFTRVWELAAGGLLAFETIPTIVKPVVRNVLAATGLLLILGSLFLITPELPFPGLLAVPPCLGALLIMLGNRDGSTWVGTLLSTRPMVFVGVISYSLYLWHWPIAVFQKNYAFLGSGLSERGDKLLIIGASMLCASLSWALIERPFRFGARRPSKRLLLQLAASGTGIVVLASSVAWASNGFSARYTTQELKIASYLDYSPQESFQAGTCFVSGTSGHWRLAPKCLEISSTKKNFLLLGDSHAAELYWGFAHSFKDTNILQASAVDCFPTVHHSITEDSNCVHVMDGVFGDFLTYRKVDRVLLVARWKETLFENVSATLDWLKQRNIPVTLVGPTLVFDSPFPRLLVSSMRSSDPSLIGRHTKEEPRALDGKMRQLAREAGVDYLSLIEAQCPKTTCVLTDSDGLPLIFDQEHLTSAGSVLLADGLAASRARWREAIAQPGDRLPFLPRTR